MLKQASVPYMHSYFRRIQREFFVQLQTFLVSEPYLRVLLARMAWIANQNYVSRERTNTRAVYGAHARIRSTLDRIHRSFCLRRCRLCLTSVKRRFYCPHCEKTLSKTSLYEHKRFFFDSKTRKWSKSGVNFVPSVGCSSLDDLRIPRNSGIETADASITADLNVIHSEENPAHRTEENTSGK